MPSDLGFRGLKGEPCIPRATIREVESAALRFCIREGRINDRAVRNSACQSVDAGPEIPIITVVRTVIGCKIQIEDARNAPRFLRDAPNFASLAVFRGYEPVSVALKDAGGRKPAQ